MNMMIVANHCSPNLVKVKPQRSIAALSGALSQVAPPLICSTSTTSLAEVLLDSSYPQHPNRQDGRKFGPQNDATINVILC
jgi:hypothetical protein